MRRWPPKLARHCTKSTKASKGRGAWQNAQARQAGRDLAHAAAGGHEEAGEEHGGQAGEEQSHALVGLVVTACLVQQVDGADESGDEAVGRRVVELHRRADLLDDALVHDDDALALLFKRCGRDKLMIGTDHPASGNIIGGAVPWIRQQSIFSEDDKDHILWRNAARFLQLDASCLPATSSSTQESVA